MESFFSSLSRERIRNIETLNHFCSKVVNNASNRGLSNLKEDLEYLCTSPFLTQLINFELSELAKNPVYVPVPASFSFFTIFDCDYCSLFILSRKGSDFNNSLHCSPHAGDRILVSLNTEGIIYNLYNQNNPYPIDIIDRNKKLTLIGENLNLDFGEAILLRKDQDVFEYSKRNHQVNVLALYSKDEGPFVWEYDLKSLHPLRIVAGNYQTSSRVEHTCTLLGEIGNVKSIEKLFQLLEHSDFNVRWEAAKSIMWIDSDKGIEALNFLKNDSHPEIFKAVEKAFKQIENQSVI